MPFVEITVASGRTPEQLRAVLREVHDAVHRALDAPEPSIRVVLREVPPEHWSSGGETLAERAARS
jgi:4-oxalocrotonate tautomerase